MYNIKHLMTGPKGNSELSFPEVEGKRNSIFFFHCEEFFLLHACWLTNFPRCHEARPDHVRVESSCCFPWGLVSLVLPSLVSFDPRHVTRSPPIGKRQKQKFGLIFSMLVSNVFLASFFFLGPFRCR